MDPLVTVCSWNTNRIMIWAWNSFRSPHGQVGSGSPGTWRRRSQTPSIPLSNPYGSPLYYPLCNSPFEEFRLLIIAQMATPTSLRHEGLSCASMSSWQLRLSQTRLRFRGLGKSLRQIQMTQMSPGKNFVSIVLGRDILFAEINSI